MPTSKTITIKLSKSHFYLVTALIIFACLAFGFFASRAAFIEPTFAPGSSVQDFEQNILGANNTDNLFDSSLVAASSTGSIIERLQHIQEEITLELPRGYFEDFMRKIKFQTGEYYHIFNRGVDKRKIFLDEKDYRRFLRSIYEFNDRNPYGGLFQKDKNRKLNQQRGSASLDEAEPLVNLVCYAFLPNHYHLLLKQTVDNGVSIYMHKLITAYTMYFNYKYKHTGGLFQGKFKAVPVKTDAQLLYVSAYINGNAEIHKIAKAEKWPWSSYQEYLEAKTSIILKEFKDDTDYRDYANEVIKNSSEIKKELKECLLE